MARDTRRRLRRRVRLPTPATLLGLAGLPGFAETENVNPPAAHPRVIARRDLINCRLLCIFGSFTAASRERTQSRTRPVEEQTPSYHLEKSGRYPS